MPRNVIPVAMLSGTKGNAHVNAAFIAGSSDNEAWPHKAGDLVVVISTGTPTRSVVLEGVVNKPQNRSADAVNPTLAAGEMMIFGPLGLNGWVQPSAGSILSYTSTSDVTGNLQLAVLRGL